MADMNFQSIKQLNGTIPPLRQADPAVASLSGANAADGNSGKSFDNCKPVRTPGFTFHQPPLSKNTFYILPECPSCPRRYLPKKRASTNFSVQQLPVLQKHQSPNSDANT